MAAVKGSAASGTSRSLLRPKGVPLTGWELENAPRIAKRRDEKTCRLNFSLANSHRSHHSFIGAEFQPLRLII